MVERTDAIESLSRLENICPEVAERLWSVGIRSPSDLEERGPVRVYRAVKEAFPQQTTLSLLYALEAALWGEREAGLPERVRAELRAELERGRDG